MKTVLLASLLTSASAFITPYAPSLSSRLPAAMDEMPGSINFMRKEFKFDPLKLSETYEPLLPWFRESELRHGRTAMLAVVGFIVQDFVRLPGEAYSFENVPKTINAHDKLWEMGAASPMTQLLLFIGLWDLVVTAPAAMAAHNGQREPGDFRWHTFKPKDPEKYKAKVDSELLNGRLAMCAVGGIATQSIITGHGFPYL